MCVCGYLGEWTRVQKPAWNFERRFCASLSEKMLNVPQKRISGRGRDSVHLASFYSFLHHLYRGPISLPKWVSSGRQKNPWWHRRLPCTTMSSNVEWFGNMSIILVIFKAEFPVWCCLGFRISTALSPKKESSGLRIKDRWHLNSHPTLFGHVILSWLWDWKSQPFREEPLCPYEHFMFKT